MNSMSKYSSFRKRKQILICFSSLTMLSKYTDLNQPILYISLPTGTCTKVLIGSWMFN